MKRRLAALALSTVMLLAWPASLHADYVSDYREGIRALDRKNWAEVARRMRAAIAGKNDSGELILIYGMRQEPYIPHYYLGLALFNQEDCAGAMRAWDESVQQGAIARLPQLAQLNKFRASCAAPLLAASKRAAEEEVRKAAAALEAVEATRTGRAAAWSGNAEFQNRLQTATESLERLKGETSASDLAALERLKRNATAVTASLRELESDVNSWEPPAAVAVAPPQSKERIQRKSGTTTPTPSGSTPSGSTVAVVPTTSTTAPVAPAVVAPVVVAPVRSTMPVSGDGPPALLVAGASAFFKGRYEESLSLLGETRLRDSRAAAYAHLFRAASQHALYLISGERRKELLAKATSEVAACLKLDPGLQPRRTDFSPKFVDFFARAAARAR